MSAYRHGRLKETPFTFSCDGSTLIGVLHEADSQTDLGLLTIVAGGPQYRGGCGRQLVELGRRIASEGVPVMRFDHRGLGDSSGEFRGFQHLQQDIASAIEEFVQRAPSVKRIILWGGCDAASAALLNAWKYPEVTGIIVSNPWITTEETATKARQQHYRSRLLQKSFWLKLVRMEYNVLGYIGSAFAQLLTKRQRKNPGNTNRANSTPDKPYLELMLDGLRAFHGSVLFIFSGRSLLSHQFNELVQSDDGWLHAIESGRCERVDIAAADQTFSSRIAREELLDSASNWIGKIE